MSCGSDDGSGLAPLEGEVAARTHWGVRRDGEVLLALWTLQAGASARDMVAAERSSRPEVRAFAQRMLDQRAAAQARQLALARAQDFDFLPSDVSEELLAQTQDEIAALQGAPERVDSAYLGLSCDAAAQALHLIAEQLRPAARTYALMGEIDRTRQLLQAQLEDAESLLIRFGEPPLQ